MSAITNPPTLQLTERQAKRLRYFLILHISEVYPEQIDVDSRKLLEKYIAELKAYEKT